MAVGIDSQLVELAGRNWLAAQLQRAGIEVARPERDRGIDLIAYIDRDERVPKFIARPIQIKAASKKVFSVNTKYRIFPGLLLVYVWNVNDPSKTTCCALTYNEAVDVARRMGWTKTASWKTYKNYSMTRPSARLCALLKAYEMNPENWWQKIARSRN